MCLFHDGPLLLKYKGLHYSIFITDTLTNWQRHEQPTSEIEQGVQFVIFFPSTKQSCTAVQAKFGLKKQTKPPVILSHTLIAFQWYANNNNNTNHFVKRSQVVNNAVNELSFEQ